MSEIKNNEHADLLISFELGNLANGLSGFASTLPEGGNASYFLEGVINRIHKLAKDLSDRTEPVKQEVKKAAAKKKVVKS